MTDATTDTAKPAPERRPRGEKARGKGGPWSAVVYVHGMGSQRRYEETSRLVDRLDDYVNGRQGTPKSVGMLSSIDAQVEPLRPELTDTIGYIDTRYSDGTPKPAANVRFYEAYWAPVMAETSSPLSVARWLFRQPLRPWKTLTAPWRERQRLRRATLVEMFERRGPGGSDITRGEYSDLLKHYNDFEGPDERRDFPKGSFAEFVKLIEREEKPDKTGRLVKLAKTWRRTYWLEEVRNVFVLATMALALVLLGGGLVLTVLAFLTGLVDLIVSGSPAGTTAPFKADVPTALGIAGFLAGLIGFSSFLTRYLGDVEAWATYEETELKHTARRKTLDETIAVLSHVLGPKSDCERVTVVAHSLGCSVAHDALLALARRNRAYEGQPEEQVCFEKLHHFVTMGSPIDKIEYFFESYSSRSHRYKRVIEDLRGDIGSAPFCQGKPSAPWIHWINYWDQGDIISGALHSPACAKPDKRARIDNVQVASFHFPDPGASHSAYFDHERVVGDIFEVVYRNKHGFDPAPGTGSPDDYDALDFGPGDKPASRAGYLILGLLAPWIALAGVIAWVLPSVLAIALAVDWIEAQLPRLGLTAAEITAWAPALRHTACNLWIATAVALGVLVLAFVISGRIGHRRPIPELRKPPSAPKP